jgi:hypothetical protein
MGRMRRFRPFTELADSSLEGCLWCRRSIVPSYPPRILPKLLAAGQKPRTFARK